MLEHRHLHLGSVHQHAVHAAQVADPESLGGELHGRVLSRHGVVLDGPIAVRPAADRGRTSLQRELGSRGDPGDDHDRRLEALHEQGEGIGGLRRLDAAGGSVAHVRPPTGPRVLAAVGE